MELDIGKKNGCFTVIGGIDVYQKEQVANRIQKLEQDKQKFINGETLPNCNFESVETFDKWIEDLKQSRRYKCQCKCGKIYYLTAEMFLRKRYRYCSEDCGQRKKHIQKIQSTYQREKDESWYRQLEGTIHESLEVGPCVNDAYEKLHSYGARLSYGDGTFKVYKQYRCICYLCKKEHLFISSDFEIRQGYYGINAEKGYYSNAYCDCHKISSFQWRTIKILEENSIPYRVEVTFPGLIGIGGRNELRFDFGIYDSNNTLKCLIECQGKQHEEPSEDFGGQPAYEAQQQNDELKRQYVKEHNIRLIEIKHTCNTYDKEVALLQKEGIIPLQIT